VDPWAPPAPEAAPPVEAAPEPPPSRAAPSAHSPFPPAPPPPHPERPAESEIIDRFAKGAGLSPDFLRGRDPAAFAEQLGGLIRLVVDNLKQLLNARGEAKRATRSSSQTMIQALDNNPLKFSPTSADAMAVMFGPPTTGYLGPNQALASSFADLKMHHVKTYSAMQHAVRRLAEDFDPKSIEAAMGPDRGLSAMMSSRKAKLWDAYVERWKARTLRHEDGMVDTFMMYFSEYYDADGRERR